MFYLVANLLGFVALVGILYLTGRVFDQTFFAGTGLEPAPTEGRFALGAAVWIALVFALAAVGLLRSWMIGVLLILLLVAAAASRRSAAGPAVSNSRRGPSDRDLGQLVLASTVGVVLVLSWLQALWPELSWDADTYHLTLPRLYIEHGGFRRVPFNVYSNWPLNTEMLFTLAMLARDYLLAKLTHFAFGLAAVVAIFRAAAGVGRSWAGWVAVSLFVANPVILDELRVAYVDLAYAFFFFLAFVFLHHALEQAGERRRYLLLAGVFLGIAAGIKPTGGVGVVCLALLFLVVSVRRRVPSRRLLAGLGYLLLPAVGLLLPWSIKSWILTGNPVYPFLFDVFGGPEWSSELGEQLRRWQMSLGMGRDGVDYLLLPFRVILFGGRGYDHFDGRILPLWLLLIPLALLMVRRRPLVGRCLGVAGTYFVFWALSSQQMRLLIPVLPFVAVAGAIAMVDLARRPGERTGRTVRVGVSLALSAMVAFVGYRELGPNRSMIRDYLRHGFRLKTLTVKPVFSFIDQELPAEARLMFLNTNHGFFCRRDFIADSFFEASQINALMAQRADKREVRRLLAELGVTHLLIENRDRGVPWSRSLYDFLNDPGLNRRLYRSPEGAYDVVEILDNRL